MVLKMSKTLILHGMMYVCILYSLPEGLQFFWKVLSFYTHYNLSLLPYQPLSTSPGSILGTGASLASPGISIGRTAIVVVRTPYIWSYGQYPALPVRLRSWESNPRHAAKSFWSPHQGADPFPFRPIVLGGLQTTRSQKIT